MSGDAVKIWTIPMSATRRGVRDVDLQVRVAEERNSTAVSVFPLDPAERVLQNFYIRNGRLTYGKRVFELNPCKLFVTTRRVLLKGQRASKKTKRALEVTVASIQRTSITGLSPRRDAKGEICGVEFATLDGVFVVEITRVPASFEPIIASLQPAAITERGGPAGPAPPNPPADQPERGVVPAQARVAAAARRFASSQRQVNPSLRLSAGGIFDHRKTWFYRVEATPEQCVRAFVDAFSRGGSLMARAKWTVDRTQSGATAVYQGRKGLGAAIALVSEQSGAEQQGAIGSEVRFEIDGQDGAVTYCGMWLAARSSRLGFTDDGRFFRPYMRAVEDELRTVARSVDVVKE